MRTVCGIALCVLAASGATSQHRLLLEPERTVRFITEEGTWMSLDVSPDGRSIVFDLLGDLYTLPIDGGIAKRITCGMAVDNAPRFSPDGRSITYLSDGNGAVNLWLVHADGSNTRALTRERMVRYLAPAWLSDGSGVVVPRQALSTPLQRRPTSDLLIQRLDGSPGIAVLNDHGPKPALLGGVTLAPDGRFAYAAVRWRQDHTSWDIIRIERSTGLAVPPQSHTPTPVTQRHTFRPLVSPDGSYLAYLERRDSADALIVRDLRTRHERVLVRLMDDDIIRFARQEALDLYPGYAFTPDSSAIVAAIGGRIWRIDVESGLKTPIPFKAEVELGMAALGQFEQTDDEPMLTVRQVRFPAISPDGRRVAFNALGRLWIKDLPRGVLRRLTNNQVVEDYPAWSPDGRYLAFVTWHDSSGGDIFRVRVDARCAQRGRCSPENLSNKPGFYAKLAYTPAGDLLAVRGPWPRADSLPELAGSLDWSFGDTRREWIRLPATGGQPRPITLDERELGFLDDALSLPRFGAESERVFIWQPRGAGLVSMRLDGSDRQALIKATITAPHDQPNEVALSPDGMHAVAVSSRGVHLIHRPDAVAPMAIALDGPPEPNSPVDHVSHLGEEFVSWSADGRSFYFSLAHTLFRYDLDRAARQRGSYRPRQIDINLRVPRDRPEGTIVLLGGRLITMRGREVIEKGDLVIRDNRIVEVGRSGSISIPVGAKVMDMTGKTLLPGYVDVHDHTGASLYVAGTQPPGFLALLAYGITTARNPGNPPRIIEYADRIAAGELLGPRLWSTAGTVPHNISSAPDYEMVRQAHEKYGARFLNTHTTKQYLYGDRRVRQWVVQSTRELRASTTNHGRADEALSMILDGYAGLEHDFLLGYPLYGDYVKLFAASGTVWTLTLMTRETASYFYARHDLHRQTKLKRFLPHAQLDDALRMALVRRAPTEPAYTQGPLSFQISAANAAKLLEGGGLIAMGGHGELPGLGSHMELWALALGGMKNHDVLRVGTLMGAQSLGLAKELGSFEPGKLADLQVLDANPLDDVHNTNTIRYVMKNGRLYEADTLDEIWPRRRKLPRMWWWTTDSS